MHHRKLPVMSHLHSHRFSRIKMLLMPTVGTGLLTWLFILLGGYFLVTCSSFQHVSSRIRSKLPTHYRAGIWRADQRLLASTSEPSTSSGFSNKQTSRNGNVLSTDNFDSLFTLVQDIGKIIISTEPKTGIIRSVQVARAVNKLTRRFVQNNDVFKTDDGSISPPKILKMLFEELGATYVKLGQFIASSPTLFPAEYVREFQSCLDNAPTIPFSQIRQIIQAELKRPISEVFSYVNPTPLASASIAQVHRAILRSSGKEVVIKVRKPGVDSTLQADLGFLLVATKIAEYINPSLTRLSAANIVSDIRDSMLDEVDLRKEAQNLINFRNYLERSGNSDAVAPKPEIDISTSRILVMEYLKGVPLVDLMGIRKYTSQPDMTLFTALSTWAGSVTDNDIFHADLHGGNLLVLENGKVGFIDFGIVGKLPKSIWNAMGDLVQSFVADDFYGVADALIKMGATNSEVNVDKFSREIKAVADKIVKMQPTVVVESDSEGMTLDASIALDDKETTDIVLEIVGVAEQNGLKLPREFGLLLKQSLYFDRYQKILAPSVDILRDDRVRQMIASGEGFGSSSKRGAVSSPIVIDVESSEA